jgi:N-acetylmuramoyl-L-alanine amidase
MTVPRSRLKTLRRRAGISVLVGLTTALPLLAHAQKPARAAVASPKTGALSVVRNIARSPLPRGERITVELSGEVVYSFDRVSNPDRVYFDFKNATVPAPIMAAAQALSGGLLVKTVRIGRHTDETARLVLEVAEHIRYSVFAVYSPFRLVVDVETDAPPAPVAASATDTPAAEASGPPRTAAARVASPAALPVAVVPNPDAYGPDQPLTMPPSTSEAPAVVHEKGKSVKLSSPEPATAMSRGDYSLARQLGLGVSRIVIDAGHGGHDPGAQSNGVNESELVLDVALRVEKLLKEQPGVDVVLTRRTDEFIPLEERTAIANREGADLFLSIHANASREPAARGIETYFLNFATNPAAEAVAARENATSANTMGKLPEIVKAIALNNKVAESRELATTVQTSLMRRLRTQNTSVRDLGVKQAPFVVLIGAQMPSVLAEISFLTNKPESVLLKQSSYRQRIAQALFDAVLKYQGSLKKVTSVAVKSEGR